MNLGVEFTWYGMFRKNYIYIQCTLRRDAGERRARTQKKSIRTKIQLHTFPFYFHINSIKLESNLPKGIQYTFLYKILIKNQNIVPGGHRIGFTFNKGRRDRLNPTQPNLAQSEPRRSVPTAHLKPRVHGIIIHHHRRRPPFHLQGRRFWYPPSLVISLFLFSPFF